MWTQLLVVTLATCVLGAELSQDGIQRSTRAANLDATGQVPSHETFTLSRSVSIKTPVRKSTTISHFTPADHRFDANGQVVINRSGASTTKRVASSTNSALSSFGTRPVTRKVSPSSDSLSRTVSIKTPKRVSTTISHFTPADLRFDATGSVNINHGSAQSSKASSAPKKVTRVVKQKTPTVKTPSLSLARRVTIKTPERKSSTISHFTPAVHLFDATGSVTINRGSNSAKSSSASTISSTRRAAAAAREAEEAAFRQQADAAARAAARAAERASVQASARLAAEAAAQLASAQRASSASSNNQGSLSLSRTVSIKTPERNSGVISFFTPAVHRYDATGSVTINRSGDSLAKKVVKTTTRRVSRPVTKVVSKPAALDLSRRVTIKTPERNNGVIAFFTPAVNRFDTTGSVTIKRKGESSEEKVVKTTNRRVSRPVTKVVSKPAALDLSRRVTIKTPERNNGVIAFFTPAVNRFDTTGSVTINRGSSRESTSTETVSIPKPVAAFVTQKKSSPVAPARKPTSGGKSLTRTVTVNTPERPSGVISHFTPAVHSYKAQGTVTINGN